MMAGIWGKKIGMTQLFSDDKVVPVTAIDVGHWYVTNIKTRERDGYDAIQVACPRKRYTESAFSAAWLKKPRQYFCFIKEVRQHDPVQGVKIGQAVEISTVLSEGDKVDIFGTTKGCGFAGVVRRHNFGGPPASHGATMGKRPGSIGFITAEGKVVKGKKMPGHMGVRRRVMENLDVVKIEEEANVVLVKGSVSGKSGSLVYIRKI